MTQSILKQGLKQYIVCSHTQKTMQSIHMPNTIPKQCLLIPKHPLEPTHLLPSFSFFLLVEKRPHASGKISAQMRHVVHPNGLDRAQHAENLHGDNARQERRTLGGEDFLPFRGEEENGKSFTVVARCQLYR